MNKVSKIIIACLLSVTFIFTSCSGIQNSNYSYVASFNLEFQISINKDGTIKMTGNDDTGYFDFSGWHDIKSVSASQIFIGGIKEDGTVLIESHSGYELDVTDWRDIVMLEFSAFSAYGLKKDGTIMISSVEGTEIDNIINDKVKNWTDIKYIDASLSEVVGIKKNGKVVAALCNDTELEERISKWEDMKSVSVSFDKIIGLRNDGEIVEAAHSIFGFKFDYSDELKGAVKVCAGDLFIAGLMPDGTLKVVYLNDYYEEDEDYIDYKVLDNLKDVVDINSYEDVLVALQKDGTVTVAGFNGD